MHVKIAVQSYLFRTIFREHLSNQPNRKSIMVAYNSLFEITRPVFVRFALDALKVVWSLRGFNDQ